MSKEIFKEEKIITQYDVENKQLKKRKWKIKKRKWEWETQEMTNDENEQLKKKNIVKDANIKELIEEPKEIKSPNWLELLKSLSYYWKQQI